MTDPRDLSAQRHGIKNGWAVDSTVRISHIHIIESLDSGFAGRTGTRLFDRLEGATQQKGVGLVLHTPDNRTTLFELLGSITKDAERGQRPLLHFETHGIRAVHKNVASPGIVLASGEEITWLELAGPLALINEATRLNLLVFMASCYGADVATLLQPLERAPVRLIIGPMVEVSARVIETAAHAFYSELILGANGDQAFAAINRALNPDDPGFWKIPAETLFLEILKGYYNELTTDEQIAIRVERILAELMPPESSPVSIAQQRAILTAHLSDRRQVFEECYRRFFFVDKYPEIAERFILSFERCFRDTSGADAQEL